MALTNFNVQLETNYGLDYTKGVKTIGTEYPIGTDAARVALARAKWPWFIGYMSGTGPGGITRTATAGAPLFSDAQILQMSYASASHNDVIWATGGAIGQDWFYGQLPLSRANIYWPHGSYYVNYACALNYGGYYGQGAGNYAPDQNNPLSNVCGGTRISIWHELIGGVGGWIDMPVGDNGPRKNCFESINCPVAVGGTIYAGLLGQMPWATVSMAGNWPEEGAYVESAPINGRASFTHYLGVYRLQWDGAAAWDLINIGTAAVLYTCPDNVAYPWLTTTAWTVVTGLGPAPTIGQDNPVLAIYMEGCQVDNFRFDGRKAYAPEAVNSGNDYVTTYEDGGIVIWRTGSVSQVSRCHADNFNNAGFQFASSVPGQVTNCRAFDCNYAALWMRGDGTMTITGFECDECPTVFKCEGYVDPTNPSSWLITPGCTLNVFGVKVETGTSSVPSRYKGTMLLDASGWVTATIHGVGYASAGIFPEILCRVEPYPAGFTSTNSRVTVTGLKTFGFFRTLMHHVEGASGADSRKWFLDKGEYTVKYNSTVGGFEYNSADGGTLSTPSGEAPSPLDINYPNRQQFLVMPATWTDTGATGLPTYTNPAS